MSLRSFRLALAAVTTLAITAHGHCETLIELYRIARAYDPVFQSALQATQVVRERRPQALAALLPSVNAAAARNRSQGAYTFSPAVESDRTVTGWNWSVQLTQPLWRPQSLRVLEQADALLSQAEAKLVQAEQDLMVRLIQAVADVTMVTESLAAVKTQRIALEEALAQAGRGYAVGTHAITDMHEARARRDQALAQQASAEHELTARQTDLEKILGRSPASLPSVPSGAALPISGPSDAQTWVERAREESPMVLAQRAALTAAQAELAKSNAAHQPTLDATAAYGRNFSSGSSSTPLDYTSRSRSAQLGLQLNVPLFAGGGTQARVREAAAAVEQARADLEAAERAAAAHARQSWSGLQAAGRQAQALESAVAAGEAAVKGTRAGVKAGTRVPLDVLNAEQLSATLRRDWIKARHEQWMHGVRLKASVGGLTESDLQSWDATAESVNPR